MTITLESRLRAHPEVAGQTLNGEAVLLLPTKGQVKVLNPVGARIWALLDGRRTLREIAALIGAEYDVALAEAQADLVAFVNELLQRDMVLAANE